jgi:hypothetical protein
MLKILCSCFLRISFCKTTRLPVDCREHPKPFRLSVGPAPPNNFAQKSTWHTHPEITESFHYVLQDFADFCQFFALGDL